MPSGNYASLGKRPSAGVQGGRPGAGEEDLRAYTGLREATATYFMGPFVTDNPYNKIVNGAAIGTVGTLPRNLTIVTVGGTSSATRTKLTLATNLTTVFTAAAAPAGNHTAVIRVLGANQFGEPISEDFTATISAGNSVTVYGTKIFQSISGVQIVGETNTASTDSVVVDFRVSRNPATDPPIRFGVPIRCRSLSDVEMFAFDIIGVIYVDLLNVATAPTNGTVVFDQKEQCVYHTGQITNDATRTAVYIKCRSSLGMDQGARQGDKYQKNW